MNFDEAFATCREQVSCSDVCAKYGLQVNRGGFAHCPAHPDVTPSLKVYDDAGRGFHCFSCGKGGSSIDLVMLILGLSEPLEAVRQMDADFGLNLQLDRPQTRAERQRAQRAQRERQQRNTVIERLEAWRWATAGRLADLLREADALDHEPANQREVSLVRNYDVYEYWFEMLLDGKADDVLWLFAQKERVNKRCQISEQEQN